MARHPLSVLILATLAACGAEDPGPSNAPIPEAWQRADQTRGQRPGSITLGGEDAPVGSPPAAPAAPSPGAVAEERALRGELSQLLERTWATEPGIARAERICQVRPRLSDLARRWTLALRRATAREPATEDLRRTLVELEEQCDAGEWRDHPEPVEGSFQGVAYEVERLGS